MCRPKGSKLSEEHKKRISVALKGKYHGVGRPKGYKMSDEAKKRISEANKGKQYTLGMKFSDETKRKMSESAAAAWKRKKNAE